MTAYLDAPVRSLEEVRRELLGRLDGLYDTPCPDGAAEYWRAQRMDILQRTICAVEAEMREKNR